MQRPRRRARSLSKGRRAANPRTNATQSPPITSPSAPRPSTEATVRFKVIAGRACVRPRQPHDEGPLIALF